MFGPSGPICQSCGLPLAKDPQGGGSERETKRRSTEYCSHCYRLGQFTDPDLTMEQMQMKVNGQLKGRHIPGFLAGFFSKPIPKLKRWQTR